VSSKSRSAWTRWLEASLGLGSLALALELAARPELARADSAPPPPPAERPAIEVPRPAGAPLIASYTLTAELDADQHVVRARGHIDWTNPSRTPTEELYFHLYLNAFKNEKSLFLRSPFGAGRSGSRARNWGYIDVKKLTAPELDGASLWPLRVQTPGDPDDETSVRVPLPREVAPGETLRLEIEFEAKLPEIVERTGYFRDFHFVGQWFPKLAKREPDGTWVSFPFHPQSEFYADFGDYDVTLDVPEAMVVGASGVRVSSESAGGRRRDRYVARGVHDFAWTAWPGFHETSEDIAGTRVRLLYPPGNEKNRDDTLEALRFALPYFERRYGDYPYPTLTVVHPPAGAQNAGGMEYPTLITTGGPWFTRLSGARAIEAVTIHELGHQWFYGLLASNEHRYPFLDEGVNTYAENDALETRYPDGSMFSLFGLRADAASLARAFAAAREEDAPIGLPAAEFPSFGSMAALVYSRTGAALETSARVYGRERLARALEEYARTQRFKNPTPEDLIGAVRRVVGPDAARALTLALLERGTVDYVARDVQTAQLSSPAGVFDLETGRETLPPASMTEESGWVGRVLVLRRGVVELPVDVEFIDEKGDRSRQRWDGHGPFRVFEWRGDARLSSVLVDPDHKILLDGNLFNNSVSIRRVPARRTLERSLYVFQVLFGWGTP
jgi:hypothetical protein